MLLLNEAGVTNVDVKMVSKPSLQARNFIYSANGEELVLTIQQNGFEISIKPDN
jgi:hypothetical protein